LGSDITLTSMLNVSKDVTLDLNGKTIDGTGLTSGSDVISVTSKLTVNDSSANKSGTINFGAKDIDVSANSELVLNGGTFNFTDLYTIYGYNGTKFTMTGGKIACPSNKTPIMVFSTNIAITGGVIDGQFYSKSPAYDIRGFITGDKTYATYDGVLYVGDSYTELLNDSNVSKHGPITINGFNSYYSTANALTSAALDAGCVASVDNNYYNNLKDAIAAAKSGDTVKLIADTDIDSDKITIDKNITLDLNEKTLTAENINQKLEVAKGSTLTVNNGTIKAESSTESITNTRECTIKLQAGANLNMNNVTVNDNTENIDTEQRSTGNFIYLAEDSETTTSGSSVIAKNRGTISLTNVKASLKTDKFIYLNDTVNGNGYVSGYEININGGSYTSELSGTPSILFQLSGMKANFNGVTINTKTAGCVYLPNRYDLTKGTPTNPESTPNATFEDCTFTIEGPKPSSRQWLSSIISVAEANVAQIKSGKYTLASTEASSDPYGFYVYSSNGGFIVDGGEFVNETRSQAMFTFSENTVEEFNYLNNNTPSAVVKGGDFTNAGTLTNTAKTSSDTSAAGQLKVTGGSYGSSEQVSDYVPAGSIAEKSSGSTFTIGEDPNNEWKQDKTTKTTYHYVLGKTSTLITATGVTAADSVNLRTGVHKG